VAIARCEKCGKPTGANVKPPGYSDRPYLPAGYPNSGVVCGRPGAKMMPSFGLRMMRLRRMERGQRIFEISKQTAKIRVQG